MNPIRLSVRCAALVVLAVCLGSSGRAEERLTLFVASSLTDAASEIARSYEAEFGVAVKIVPSASSTLARQIAAGAPAGVFLSAEPHWADWLTGQGIGDAAQARIFAGNALVIIAASDREATAGSPADVLKRTAGSRMAIADPDHVPAGR